MFAVVEDHQEAAGAKLREQRFHRFPSGDLPQPQAAHYRTRHGTRIPDRREVHKSRLPSAGPSMVSDLNSQTGFAAAAPARDRHEPTIVQEPHQLAAVEIPADEP